MKKNTSHSKTTNIAKLKLKRLQEIKEDIFTKLKKNNHKTKRNNNIPGFFFFTLVSHRVKF